VGYFIELWLQKDILLAQGASKRLQPPKLPHFEKVKLIKHFDNIQNS